MNFDLMLKERFADVVRGREDMHSYQDGPGMLVDFVKAQAAGFVIVDMGLGKTVSVATAISDMILSGYEDKILIIGPPRVAIETWPTEFRLWQHLAWIVPELLYVDDDDPELAAADRKAQHYARMHGKSPTECRSIGQKARTVRKNELLAIKARSTKQVHILPNHYVEWLVNLYEGGWPYRWVIIDESSAFKDHKAGRFKALKKTRKSKIRGKLLINKMTLMSATPAAETQAHLFTQVYLLDGGKRFGVYVTKFQNEYFTYNQWSRKLTPREGTEEKLMEKIADISMVLKAKDYLPLKDPTVLCRPIHLTEKQMGMYSTLEKEFIVELDDGTEIEAETAAALSQKLLQLSSGVLYETVDVPAENGFVRKSTKVHKIHDHKIEELKEIVDEIQGKPILVAYHFKSSLERLQKAFPKAVVMDREGKCVKKWNDGKIPMLLMHPMSGGHGLNLQHGGHHMVFFDLPWSLELYIQFIGRLARQGQKNPVIVWLLTVVGTIDYTVYDGLARKQDMQEKLIRRLRRKIAAFRKLRESLKSHAARDAQNDDEL